MNAVNIMATKPIEPKPAGGNVHQVTTKTPIANNAKPDQGFGDVLQQADQALDAEQLAQHDSNLDEAAEMPMLSGINSLIVAVELHSGWTGEIVADKIAAPEKNVAQPVNMLIGTKLEPPGAAFTTLLQSATNEVPTLPADNNSKTLDMPAATLLKSGGLQAKTGLNLANMQAAAETGLPIETLSKAGDLSAVVLPQIEDAQVKTGLNLANMQTASAIDLPTEALSKAGDLSAMVLPKIRDLQAATETDLPIETLLKSNADRSNMQPTSSKIAAAIAQPILQPTHLAANTAKNLLDLLNGKNLINPAIVAGESMTAEPITSPAVASVIPETLAQTAKNVAPLAVTALKSSKPAAATENLLPEGSAETSVTEVKSAIFSAIKLPADNKSMPDLLKHTNTAFKAPEEVQAKLSVDSLAAEPEPVVKPMETTTLFNQLINTSGDYRSAGTSAVALSTETPETLAKYNITDQIIEQAQLIKTTEDTQMVIKLKPDHLGDLTLKVTVENGMVSATFHSDNAAVRSMLETSLIQLKQELAAQGIKVDNVGVYAGLGQFMSDGQEQANRQQQQNSRFKNRKIDLADFTDEVDKVGAAPTNKANEDGVDYRI